ncbi:hypothetical protein PVAP13_8NG152501 [Panicum virgatum]|uniref:Uncharacterized protein n=1 Tax=Panicum virgatum TaxID=38727 RepID=A0A8T0P9E4_PANVG|nr:hypothetical protein PVAP13_8NG152501 [Panicum virgatum]
MPSHKEFSSATLFHKITNDWMIIILGMLSLVFYKVNLYFCLQKPHYVHIMCKSVEYMARNIVMMNLFPTFIFCPFLASTTYHAVTVQSWICTSVQDLVPFHWTIQGHLIANPCVHSKIWVLIKARFFPFPTCLHFTIFEKVALCFFSKKKRQYGGYVYVLDF